MPETILFVDDDVRVVSAIQRRLHQRYSVEIAEGPQQALDAITERSCPVVVSDLNMPGINGIEFLRRVKYVAPNTIGILLTGQADLESAISAVNDGHIFRFLRKPCPHELLTRTLDAALAQYHLICAEKSVFQETLVATIGILIETFRSMSPWVFARAPGICSLVRDIGRELKLSHLWELEAAGLLSHVGCVSVSAEVLRKYYGGEVLNERETEELEQYPRIGGELLRGVPRLATVAEIIGSHRQPFRSTSTLQPELLKITIGAHVLRAAADFDRLLGIGFSVEESLNQMRKKHAEYNQHVLDALERVVAGISDRGSGTSASNPPGESRVGEYTSR